MQVVPALVLVLAAPVRQQPAREPLEQVVAQGQPLLLPPLPFFAVSRRRCVAFLKSFKLFDQVTEVSGVFVGTFLLNNRHHISNRIDRG